MPPADSADANSWKGRTTRSASGGSFSGVGFSGFAFMEEIYDDDAANGLDGNGKIGYIFEVTD